MTFYTRTDPINGSCICFLDENGDEWAIPQDVSNRHYQMYLAWLEEGNVPEDVSLEAPQ
jgi:hypothetical protein